MHFRAGSSIDAPPLRVWEVLTDTAHWPEWDPSCDRIEGEPRLGGKVKAYTKLAPGRAFPVTVTTLEAPRLMVWSGGMPFGLFKGVRTFSLTPRADGGTDFALTETFSGPILSAFRKQLPDMTEAFEGFVAGLKSRSEARQDGSK